MTCQTPIKTALAALRNHRGVLRCFMLLVGVAAFSSAARGQAMDAVKFATNWRAQAEHGGFYQALATGIYREHDLDVQIVQGGPLVNHRAQLMVGRIEFLMGSNLIQALDAVKQRLPSVVVAATFQKDVHCLIAHPGQGNDRWEDLKRAKLLIGAAGRQTYHRWLQSAHGFPANGVRNYTFNLAPFLANKKLVQQGFMTAEPLAIAKAIGREPRVYLLADHGWSTYSTLIETRRDYAEQNPEIVQRFVDASILGWVSYLYGDPRPAHAAIRRDNREMSLEQLTYSRSKLIEHGIVDSGDTIEKGIGAIDSERVRDFYDKMVDAGMYRAGDVDLAKVCRLEFVNRGVGLAQKEELVADTQ